jgi:hypothetical protein
MVSAVTPPGACKLICQLLRDEDGYRIKEYSIDSKHKVKRCEELYRGMDLEGRVVLGFRNED